MANRIVCTDPCKLKECDNQAIESKTEDETDISLDDNNDNSNIINFNEHRSSQCQFTHDECNETANSMEMIT